MGVYLLLDENDIVRCLSSDECNLHSDKLHFKKVYAEYGGVVGDEYDPVLKKWSKRPENYPVKSEFETKEAMIKQKIREMAEAELVKEGKINA